jgi:hypothetical protein
MWRCILPVLLALNSWGQLLLNPGSPQERELKRFFDSAEGVKESPDKRLRCGVFTFPTRLSFGFQHWTGYDIAMPVRQFASRGRERPMVIALRVTPETPGKTPSFFYSKAAFPRKAPPQFWTTGNAEMNLGGGFVVGEGKYRVNLWVMDSAGRSCRKDWKIEARSPGVPLQIGPGEVAETGMESWKGMTGGSGKLSVLIHAAPMFRRRIMTKLSAWDRAVLLNSLRSLLDTGGYAEAKVKVFDFDGRRVIFESDNFGAPDFDRLMDALMNLNIGTVSYDTLKGVDEEGFLGNLVREEVGQKQPSDAVVFLGPSWRWGQKISPLLRELRAQLPTTYYVSLTPWNATATDLLEKFVKAGPKGKVLTVYQPIDLAKAIREIRDRRN